MTPAADRGSSPAQAASPRHSPIAMLSRGVMKKRHGHGPSAKPAPPSSSDRLRRFLLILGVAALVDSALFTFVATSGRRPGLVRRQKDYGPDQQQQQQKEQQLAPSLACPKVDGFEICSHQLLNPPSAPDDSTSTTGGAFASMSAMYNADNGGIRCFDVDAVTLKDGNLLVGHPTRFAARIGKTSEGATSLAKAEYYTLDEARAAGASRDEFPLLKDLLNHFAAMIRRSEQHMHPFYPSSLDEWQENASRDKRSKRRGIPRLSSPLLSIELKGPNLTPQHLQDIADAVARLGIESNIGLCVSALADGDIGPGVDVLNLLGRSKLSMPLGLVLRDRVKGDWDHNKATILADDYLALKFIQASNKFDSSWFDDVAMTLEPSLPVQSWVVDDEEGLIHAINCGVSAVVSNHPVKMQSILARLKESCHTEIGQQLRQQKQIK